MTTWLQERYKLFLNPAGGPREAYGILLLLCFTVTRFRCQIFFRRRGVIRRDDGVSSIPPVFFFLKWRKGTLIPPVWAFNELPVDPGVHHFGQEQKVFFFHRNFKRFASDFGANKKKKCPKCTPSHKKRSIRVACYLPNDSGWIACDPEACSGPRFKVGSLSGL